jgi:hypothetical protein
MASKSQLVSALSICRDETGILPELNAIIGAYGCLHPVRWTRAGKGQIADDEIRVQISDDGKSVCGVNGYIGVAQSSFSLEKLVRHWRIRIVGTDGWVSVRCTNGRYKNLHSNGYSADGVFDPFKSDELIDITTDMDQKTMTITAQGKQIVWLDVDDDSCFSAAFNDRTTIRICDVE